MALARIDIIGQNGNEGLHYNSVYVVVMKHDSHSYVLGVYSDIETAKYNGKLEESWRGGKYTYHTEAFLLNEEPSDEKKANHFAMETERVEQVN